MSSQQLQSHYISLKVIKQSQNHSIILNVYIQQSECHYFYKWMHSTVAKPLDNWMHKFNSHRAILFLTWVQQSKYQYILKMVTFNSHKADISWMATFNNHTTNLFFPILSTNLYIKWKSTINIDTQKQQNMSKNKKC